MTREADDLPVIASAAGVAVLDAAASWPAAGIFATLALTIVDWRVGYAVLPASTVSTAPEIFLPASPIK